MPEIPDRTDNRPDCNGNSYDYLHRCQIENPLIDDPFFYDRYFLIEDPDGDNESRMFDDHIEQYVGLYGNMTDVYIVSSYNPCPVFGEDPSKGWELPPLRAKAIFDPTRETMKYGTYGRNTEDEMIELHFHIGQVKREIEKQLLEYGIIEADDSGIIDYDGLNQYQRHRLELQEGDVIRLYYNNLHYIIDGIKREPEYMHLMRKYVYTCTCRPILVTGEKLGHIQDTEIQENIIERNSAEIDNAVDRLIF